MTVTDSNLLHFIDTSSFVKLFVAEAGSVAMTRFATQQRDENKVLCALASVEARSAFVKLYRMSLLTSDQLTLSLAILNDELLRVSIQPVTPAVLKKAGELVERHSLRALDAVQLASAIEVRSSAVHTGVRFIASDQELLEAAMLEGFETWNPVNP